MIDSFKRIGEEISKEFDKLPEIERKKAVLDCLTLPIKETYYVKDKQKPVYEIIIDFDTKNSKITFNVGSQLRKDNRTKYFGFSAGSNTSGKKTYLTTNNLSYHLSNTIPDTASYIDEIEDSTYDFSTFKIFLEDIRDKFYKKSGKKYLLNRELYAKPTDDEMDFLAQKIGINKKEFTDNFRVFSLNFDEKPILETQYSEAYTQLRYYYSIERFFKTNKGIKGKKRSHFSGQLSQITKNVDIPLKFYITDQAKPVMFENININNSYKSFCVNQQEYEHLLIGCNFILENLKESFNGIRFLLVPKSEGFFRDVDDNTQFLKWSIKKIESKRFQKEHEKIESINKNNFYFDMLFFEKDQSAFNIFKIISDISTLRLEEISDSIEQINLSYIRLKWNTYSFSLNTVWHSLYSQIIKGIKKDKQKNLFRSDFLDYLDVIYSGRKLKEIRFVHNSLKNIKKGHYENKKNEDSNYHFLIWNSFESLLLFRKLNIIRGVKMEEKRKELIVKLKNEKIQKFFDNYSEIFGENLENGREKQGLVLLGYLVNQIVWAQKSKSENRSSTFLDKIHYSGIKKERLQNFINEVLEFLKLYSTKEKPLLDYNKNIIAAMQEHLLVLHKSSLKKEEITYYILLGNFLGSQIGFSSSKEKTGGKEDGNNTTSSSGENTESNTDGGEQNDHKE